ncbi:hypothetical protein [Prosthecobacter sp.]|uniref:hypothetical protein n=1 Tax=Prosthecobacter sp. TaxID=1965333 RepID=UPI003784E329
MTLPIHRVIPRRERLARTVFWTLWIATVVSTVFALCVELFGIGLFLHDDHAPKLHMRGEARMANAINSAAAIALAIVTVIIGRWSRTLRRLGIAALLFFLFHLAIPHF